jgi:hypothetical protein
MRPRFRFDPLHFFGPLEAMTIFSLIYCPAPWLSTGGYSAHAVIWSMGLGITLATIAYAHGVMKVITFRTHLAALALVGLICLALAFVSVPRLSASFYAFAISGFIFLAEATVMELRLSQMGRARRKEEIKKPIEPVISEKRAA